MVKENGKDRQLIERRLIEECVKAVKKHVGEDYEWGINRIFLEIELAEIFKNYDIYKI